MRRLTPLFVVALVLATGACSAKTDNASRQGTTTTTSRGAARTASSPFPVGETQSQIMHDIRTDGLTAERALMLFSIQIGPLPGVPAHTGSVDKTDFDGSMATSYLYGVWDELTVGQRKAAARLLGQPNQAAPPTTISFGRGAAGGTTTPTPRQISLGSPTSRRDTPAYDYLHLAESASVAEAAELGAKPISKFRIDVSYDLPGTAYASTTWYYKPWYATAYQPFGDGCHITIWNQKMAAVPGNDAAAVMAHEVFHCYQQVAVGSGEAVATVSPWVEEGEATWVMAQVVPSGSGVVENKWSKYTFTPMTAYVDRSYDALGVFGHYGDVVRDQSAVWPRLLPTVVAAVGGHDSDALGVLIAGSETDYYEQWGASYFEDAANPSWKMTGPGSPPSAGPTPEHLTIGAGNSHALPFGGPAQATQAVIESSADVLIVYLMDGYGRLHDEGFGVDTPLNQTGPVALCLRDGGCTCPDGSPGASEHTTPAKGPITVGLDGGNHTAQAGAAGKSLDEFCKKPDKPPTVPGGGGGKGGGGGSTSDSADTPPGPTSGGRTTGDPHLTTIDGLHYDFQTVGEFTLAQSTTDNFLVQVRQVAAKASQFASLNTAMATRVGGRRLEIAVEGDHTVLRVDGAVTTKLPDRLGGTTISRSSTMFGDSYTLTWPDGTVVRAVPIGPFGLNVEVAPAPKRKGKLAGLLGNFDGNPANDLSTGTGAPLGTFPSADVVDHAFADHWRITQAGSLFTYPAGRNTASYTDRKFPYTSAIPNRAAAEKVCRDAGITDATLLQACVVDLAATNDPLFASMYGYGQAVDDARSGHVSGRHRPARSIASSR